MRTKKHSEIAYRMMRKLGHFTDRRAAELVFRSGVGLALAFAGVDLLRDHLSSLAVLVGDLAARYGLSGLGYRP